MIQKIIKDIKDNLETEADIVSLTLVGSFSNMNKHLEKFNDLDFVIICDNINKIFFNKLNELIKNLRKRYSSDKIGITSSFDIGPIKIKSPKEKTIMIHFLIYTPKGYKKYESSLTRFSFQHYNPLVGLPLSKISNIPSVSVKDIFNKIDGIPAMKDWIIKKEVFYLKPTPKKIEIIKKKLETREYLEVIFYSVLRLSSNMLRTKNIYAETDLSMCKYFVKEFPIKINKFPFEIFQNKEQLRKGEIFTKKETENFKNNSLKFIRECEDFLEKKRALPSPHPQIRRFKFL